MTKLNKHLYKLSIFYGLCLSLVLISCDSNPLDIDVSDVEVTLKLERMEQDVFTDNIPSAIERNKILIKKYGLLYEAFMMEMIGEGSPYDAEDAMYLKNISEHPDMKEIYQEIDNKYHDFSKYHTEIEGCFKYYKHYFPDSTLPTVITFYSNFNANIMTGGHEIGRAHV